MACTDSLSIAATTIATGSTELPLSMQRGALRWSQRGSAEPDS
jgi:hypothetical protein